MAKVSTMPKPKPSLDERLKAVANAASASMIPVPSVAPPPPKDEPKIPDITKLIVVPADRLRLLKLIDEAMPLQAQMNEAKRALEGKRPDLGGVSLKNTIKNILGQYRVGEALAGDVKLKYSSSKTPRRTLSEKKLLSNGVSPDIIAASYDETYVYTLRMTRVGEEEDEEE